MRHSRSVAVLLVLLAVGAHASNPLHDAFGTAKAVGDQLGGNITAKANAALNQAATAAFDATNATVAPIKAKVTAIQKAVDDKLAPVAESVLAPVRSVVKQVSDTVQSKVDQAAKLLPTGKVDSWKSAMLVSFLKESGLYEKLNSSFPAGGFKIPDIPAEIQKAQLQKLAVLAQLNSTLASAQQLKSALISSALKDSGALALLAALQNKTGLPIADKVSSAAGAGVPSLSIPKLPSAPAMPAIPSIDALKAALPNVTGEDILARLNLTGLPAMADAQLSALAKSLGISGAGSPGGIADLKLAVFLSLIKQLPGGEQKAALITGAQKKVSDAVSQAHAAVLKGAEAKLKAANDALAALLKKAAALKADPKKYVSDEIASAIKQAQAAFDAKLKLANAALDAANKAAQQLAAAKQALIANPKAAVAGAIGNLTSTLEGCVKAATDAVSAAQKQAASLLDSKLAAVGLGGVAANSTQIIDSRLRAATAAASNVTQVADALKANPIKAANDALAAATKQAQALLDAKVKAANDAIALANKQVEQLTAAKLAAANGVQAAVEGLIGNLTRQAEGLVKQANDCIFAAQKQAASVIDAKLAALGLPGVAGNCTQALQDQVRAIGAAYQNLTRIAAGAKTNPGKAANEAIALAAQQANAALDAKMNAVSNAYAAALKQAQSVVAAKLQMLGGAQSIGAQALANLTQQFEAKVKAAQDALAAAHKQANSMIDSKLAMVGLGGLAANTSALIDGKLKQVTDKLTGLLKQAQAIKAAPIKAANGAIANVTKTAQSVLDAKIKAANDAIDAANKLVNQLLTAKAGATAGLTMHAQSLLGELSNALEGKIKMANDAIAAGQKQVASLKSAIGHKVGGAAANATALAA